MPDGDVFQEAEALLGQAYERLEVAELLLQEGHLPDAINRAYYAMHNAARALLATRNIAPKSHRGVIRMFGLEFITTSFIDELHLRTLTSTLEFRQRADYGIQQVFTTEQATEIVENADRFVSVVAAAIGSLKAD